MRYIIIILWLGLFQTQSLDAQTTINYPSSDLAIANPERGWFYSIGAWNNNDMQAFPSVTELENMRTGADKITLIRRYYVLDDFLNSPISQALLDEFQANCDQLRATGFKLIPRFVYNWSYALPQFDATVSRTHQHLNQLKPYLENNKDVIAHIEAGLIGHFGEWHNSSENHVDNFYLRVRAGGHAILDSLLNATPPELMVATRYYYHNKMKYLENYHGVSNPIDRLLAFDQSNAARIGTHNDAIMFDQNWMWHHDSIPEQQNYASEDLQWVVTSGEPLPSSYALSNSPLPELASLHFNSLAMNANIEGGTDLYDYWKNQGYYQELTKKLGYRFQLVEAIIDDVVAAGEQLNLTIEVENLGYGSLYNLRTSELILRNTTTLLETKIDITNQIDLRYITTGVHQLNLNIDIPNDIDPGKYDLLINFPDPAPNLQTDARFSIQLANQGTWESATGYNSLLHEISVTATPLPLDLIHFRGRLKTDHLVELMWQTQFEINVLGFEVQKLSSAGIWESISFVPSNENLSGAYNMYNLVDVISDRNTQYYRLRIIDHDQSFTWSPIIAIEVPELSKVTIYPTIVKDEFTIAGNLTESKVMVYDLRGVHHYQQTVSDAHRNVNISSLPAGIYVVLVTDQTNQIISSQKIVKE